MRVSILGGGPAGLYSAILLKKAWPDAVVDVHERNRPDDTFGWGVVFSDETLGHFEAADPETYAEIRRAFAYWTDIETWLRGTWTRSTGHGFCGLSRRRLLEIFQERARGLGARLHFQSDLRDETALPASDLVIAADGIQSAVRTRDAEWFRPSLDWRKCKFTWLGTTKPLAAFTFVFLETEWGVFAVHAYPFEAGLSTWIVECREETWRRAGLEHASEADTVAFCERLFAPFLDGHKLLANRSIWRTFPTVRCERWSRGNVVLLGDAAHTAHFSIGSGTKLAMEDAIALCDAFRAHGWADVPATLQAYERARRLDVLKLQRAAQTSLEWFESTERHVRQGPVEFTFNLMTRSKRITFANLAKRDPKLVEAAARDFAARNGAPVAPGARVPPPAFTPIDLRGLRLANRVVVSPMCQYSATAGLPGDWHLVHLGSRALGGAGLVIAEATAVAPEGRITLGCTGLWSAAHAAAWKRIVDFAHQEARTKIGIQLGHAGRKASCNLPWEGDDPLRDARAWRTLGPSAAAFGPDWPAPKAMDADDRRRVETDLVRAVQLADAAGFDLVELHMAHGYLFSSWLSPLANQRSDEHGGSRENRMRWPLRVFELARAAWPAAKPMFVRISASDWLEPRGWTVDDSVAFARELGARGCDVVDVSSAGNSPESRPEYGRMYQVPFAERIRAEAGVRVMAVGGIQSVDHVDTVLAAGRADLCALARPHLFDPYLTLHGAAEAGVDVRWPDQYLAVKPRGRAGAGAD
ncbi:MAG: FAD-dependent monooxygenase [Planctomycetes bacterium]|nr:FAD-dependent monooxygenase [Planctomycetota bacterium]